MSYFDQCFSITPQTADEVKDVETPEGMRRRINIYGRYNSLVKAVMDMAWHRGLSGEDMMTVLAFEALKRLEALEAHIIDDAMLRPVPLMVKP